MKIGGLPTRRVLQVLRENGYSVRYLARLFATSSTWVEARLGGKTALVPLRVRRAA